VKDWAKLVGLRKHGGGMLVKRFRERREMNDVEQKWLDSTRLLSWC